MSIDKQKKYILGQYFTKKEIVSKVANLVLEYKTYNKTIRILEPSFGIGNFIEILKNKNFNNIIGCELDPTFTDNPCDFFNLTLNEKFDLIIGNPPFTKYNIKESYYYPKNYLNNPVKIEDYLPPILIKKDKIQIENAFILKSIKHLKENGSTIGFVLPISFFIKNKNIDIKKIILKNFSTIIIYQDDQKWFDEPISCCFAIFTNIKNFENKIILLYENKSKIKKVLDKSALLIEELIPKSFLYKKENNQSGIQLSEFLSVKNVKYRKSYEINNISGANILKYQKIPTKKNIEDYYLAIVRVGNASVGRTGLINIREDILNDMFYVFDFKDKYKNDREIKETISVLLNKNQEHFKKLTVRVGSKSIKKSDIFEFKIKIKLIYSILK